MVTVSKGLEKFLNPLRYLPMRNNPASLFLWLWFILLLFTGDCSGKRVPFVLYEDLFSLNGGDPVQRGRHTSQYRVQSEVI